MGNGEAPVARPTPGIWVHAFAGTTAEKLRRVGKARRAHGLCACCDLSVRYRGFAWATAKPRLPTLRVLLRGRDLRGRGLLLLVEPIEDATRLDHAGVGVDVSLRRIGNYQQIALLPFEDGDVLEEGGLDLLRQHVLRLWIMDVGGVCLTPAIMAGCSGLPPEGG